MFEDDGQVRRHAGGYSEWLERHRALAVVDEPTDACALKSRGTRANDRRSASCRTSCSASSTPCPIRSQRSSRRVAELRAIVNDAGFYQRPHGEVQQSLDALRDAEREVEAAVDRWGELEEQAAAAASGDAS